MNDIEEKKKSNGLLVIVIVLLVILIGVGDVIIYQNYQNNNTKDNNDELVDKNDDTNNDNDAFKGNETESIGIDSELVKILVDKLSAFDDFAFTYLYPGSSSNKKFGILYKQDKLLAENLPIDVKTYLVSANLYSEKRDTIGGYECEYRISNEEFKDQYYKLFGKGTTYEIVEFNFSLPILWFQDGEIIIGACGGDTRGPGYFIYRKFVKAEKTDGELYLYEKVAFADETDEVFDENVFYSDVEYTNKIIEGVSEEEIFSSKYIDKLPEYKYTFKLEDGNYYFESVERVK